MAFKEGFVGDLHFGESGGHVEEAGIFVLYTFTLPETNIFADENGWLEYDRFLLGWPVFRCKLLVSGRVHAIVLPCFMVGNFPQRGISRVEGHDSYCAQGLVAIPGFRGKRTYPTRWAPTSYKWGCNPSYPFIRPFIVVITPLISFRGPPCRDPGSPSENGNLGGGFKYFLFSPLFGEDSHFD